MATNITNITQNVLNQSKQTKDDDAAAAQQKLMELIQALADGTYTIDAENLAEKMLALDEH